MDIEVLRQYWSKKDERFLIPDGEGHVEYLHHLVVWGRFKSEPPYRFSFESEDLRGKYIEESKKSDNQLFEYLVNLGWEPKEDGVFYEI